MNSDGRLETAPSTTFRLATSDHRRHAIKRVIDTTWFEETLVTSAEPVTETATSRRTMPIGARGMWLPFRCKTRILTPLFGRARPGHESSFGVAVLPGDWDDAAKKEAMRQVATEPQLPPVDSGWCSACQPCGSAKSEIR
jgi:hypothetical protein